MAVSFTIADEDLVTADLAAETAGLSILEKIEWVIIYTHRAVNLQGRLAKAWTLADLPYLGEDIPIPTAAKDAWKAKVNTLAAQIITAETFVEDSTD